MRLIKFLSNAVGLFVMLAVVASEAWAGPVTIATPSGGKVEVNFTLNNGTTGRLVVKDNDPADENKELGKFTFTIPNEAGTRSVEIKTLRADGGHPVFSKMDFGSAGLLSYEPIDLFTFSSVDANTILLSVMDVSTFISGGVGFSEGQVLQVVNGLASGVDGVIFYDASVLFSGVGSFFDVFFDLDPTLIGNLPMYGGDVLVGPSVGFRVPEPGSLVLVVFGVLGMVFSMRSRKINNRRVVSVS